VAIKGDQPVDNAEEDARMAKTFERTRMRRLVDAMVRGLLRLGLGSKTTYLLTVRGRRSGAPRSTPVIPVEDGGQRWLVAPYEAVGWVRNARAAGEVTLSRAGRSETFRIDELDATEAAPILTRYIALAPIMRPYFDAGPNDPPEAFAAEAERHPVFRLLMRNDSSMA
jgi:deazaflavin-dependent oxidoreductase (nitroreductase family)